MTITQQIIEIHHGKTARQIAELVGCSQATVRSVARFHGLTLKRSTTKFKVMHPAAVRSFNRIKHKYPLDELARMFGISKAHASRMRSGEHFQDAGELEYIAEKSLHNDKQLRGPIR